MQDLDPAIEAYRRLPKAELKVLCEGLKPKVTEDGTLEKKPKNPALTNACAHESFQNAEKDLTTARSAVVEFNLPALPKFEVPLQVAPAFLSAIVLLLAIYLTIMRGRTFCYLGRGMRILRDDLKNPIEQIGDVLSPRYWWIAPLPRKPGASVSAEEFSIALGWNLPAQAKPVTIIFFWLVLLSIQLRLTVTGRVSPWRQWQTAIPLDFSDPWYIHLPHGLPASAT